MKIESNKWETFGAQVFRRRFAFDGGAVITLVQKIGTEAITYAVYYQYPPIQGGSYGLLGETSTGWKDSFKEVRRKMAARTSNLLKFRAVEIW